jgi:hypothetical protein
VGVKYTPISAKRALVAE